MTVPQTIGYLAACRDRARRALDAHAEAQDYPGRPDDGLATDETRCRALASILSDLRHWARDAGISWLTALYQADMAYHREIRCYPESERLN